MSKVLCIVISACLVSSCSSIPPSRYSPAKRLADPCWYRAEKIADGQYSLRVSHHPELLDPPLLGFASGDFDASVTVDVTAARFTGKKVIDIDSDVVAAPIPSIAPIDVVSDGSCVAYDPH